MIVRALLLILLLLPVASAAAPVALVLWHSYRAEEKLALEESVAAFHRQQDRLRLKLLPVPSDAFADKITSAVPVGKGPDLIIHAHDRVGDWAAAGLLEPIEFWCDEALLSRFFRPTVDALVVDDSLYGLPLAFKSLALFYNRALVQSPPDTVEELFSIARGATDRRAGRYGLVYESTSLYFHAPWLFAFGGTLLDGSGRPSLNTDGNVRSLAFARRLAVDERVVPDEVTGALVTTLFNQGRAAMVVNGPWFLGEVDRRVDFGVAPLPFIEDAGSVARPFLGSEGVLVSAFGRHKREAFDAAVFLTSDASAAIRLRRARQSVANAALYDGAVDPSVSAFRRQLENAVVTPSGPGMRHVWGPMDAALSQVLRQGRIPEDALQEAQRRALSTFGQTER